MSDYQIVIDSAAVDVTIGTTAELHTEQAVQYIKSGETEIDTYVRKTSEPEIDAYIENKTKPEIDGYVANVSKPDLDSYVENTSKPDIDAYVENTTKPDIRGYASARVAEYDANAAAKLTAYNSNDTTKTNAYNNNAADKLTAYNNNDAAKIGAYNSNAETKVAAYNGNADNKTKTYNDNAEAKQAEVNASATAAADSAAAALSSERNANAAMTAAAASAQAAALSETEALNSETAAAESEARCEEIFARLGTVIKIKGRVDTPEDLPQTGNLDGDAYLVGAAGLTAYPEYYWFSDHWEFLGTSADKIEWGTLQGNIANQTDLQSVLIGKQAVITGAASTITANNLTENRALIANNSGKVAASDVTSTELGYVHGVTSAIQTQLNGKQAVITGAASTITANNLTGNRALVSDSSGKVAVSAVTSTELGYLDGVTSNVQTQLNGKANVGLDNLSSAGNTVIDNRIINILKTIYPVGSVYIGTQSTCPLATLISGSSWSQVATNVVVGVNTDVPVKGNGMTLGLTDGTNNCGMANGYGVTRNYGCLGVTKNYYGSNIGTQFGESQQFTITDYSTYGITTDSSKSGIVGTVTRTNLAVNIWKRTA